MFNGNSIKIKNYTIIVYQNHIIHFILTKKYVHFILYIFKYLLFVKYEIFIIYNIISLK